MLQQLLPLFSRCDSILVLDTETSGLSHTHDEIIEFSAAKIACVDGRVQVLAEVDEFIRRENDRKLAPRIVELTGITDEMLREDGISKGALCEILAQLLTPNTMIAAYNAQFDLLFLYALLAKYGDARLLQGKPKLDLLTVYRDRRAYPHRLSNAIEAYCLQDAVQNSHRAIDDVRATVAVMCKLWEEKADLLRYIDLFGYSAKYGVSGARIGSVRYAPQGFDCGCALYEEKL
ncbi:MAG: 3'-5' exonuclease [Oscillospiraceae bacterium]|jgi:DNA polymerase III alpha subunit (gram-positive type)|nr:3'-5' exonuclease [Oscillospiraceae bacterium]